MKRGFGRCESRAMIDPDILKHIPRYEAQSYFIIRVVVLF